LGRAGFRTGSFFYQPPGLSRRGGLAFARIDGYDTIVENFGVKGRPQELWWSRPQYTSYSDVLGKIAENRKKKGESPA